ncbi:MAG: diaminopimelate epimerase [Acetobacteraceae bacterium]
MRVPFRKMHGAGNDFVILDERAGRLGIGAERARAIADRHRGVGCDQIILLEPPPAGADVAMRILNADGSESGACGNASRCVARILAEESGASRCTIRTIAGDLAAEVLAGGTIRVDLGPARLGWQEIPLARAMDTLHLPLSAGPLADPAACSMGNPHATFFVSDLAAVPLAALGPALEHDPLFPERANIGVAEILAPDRIRLRVWERGAGLTRACGSGACAALVNAHRRGLAGRRASLVLDGGVLDIAWREDGHVLMAGPAETAFAGAIELAEEPA